MKNERLRDGDAADPSWAALERLCQSQPPTAPDLAMQARVLGRLERPRRRALRVRPAFAALCVLLFAGTASAMWGIARRWLAPARPTATATATAPAPLAVRPAVAPAASPSPTTAPADSAPAPSVVRAVAPPAHVQRRKRVVAVEAAAESVAAKPIETSPPPPSRSTSPLDPQESVLVHAAVRALRVDGRASRARELLGDYLSRFPHGALAEDAVALQIEAAVADRDASAARRWAARYVDEFPAGRFHAVADSVLREDSSKSDSRSRP
ncbi:MAG TPA: hypothetical protein VN947_08160 [Polyangia bacterium]|nr:hypothetical protein [Polyangia bacterium]